MSRPRRTPDPALVPVRKTDFSRRITHGGRGLSGHRECWRAETLDGVWALERLDEPGTPWELFHRPTRLSAGEYGTLRAARLAVGHGDAERNIKARVSEELPRLDRLITERAARVADLPPDQRDATPVGWGVSEQQHLDGLRERRDRLLAWQAAQAKETTDADIC